MPGEEGSPATASRNGEPDPAVTGAVGRYGRKIGFLGLVIFLYATLSSGAGNLERDRPE
jgi:hypothetical protein